MTRRQFDKQVKIVRSDNGLEFHSLKEYFLEQGIIFQTSCVYTPQQNGRVERKHRHILDMARTLRFHANLPITFWGECILTAGYLINRLPSPISDNKSPYELLYHKVPSYDRLRVFGCLCYAHNKDRNGDKFASRGVKCVFLGYAYSQKGWKVFDLENQRHFISRDVRFFESNFPFKQLAKESHAPTGGQDDDPRTDDAATWLRWIHSDDLAEFTNDSSRLPNDGSKAISHADGSNESTHADGSNESSHGDSHVEGESTSHATGDSTLTSSSIPVTSIQGKRPRKPPIWHQDYDVQLNTVKINSPSNVCTTPKANSALSASKEPTSYHEAVRDPNWREAMQREIKALEQTGTWRVQPLPPGKKAIFCKWVFKIKYKTDGTIARYKARLVVCGNRQVHGIDYSETFAPVAKMVTVRTIMAVAAVRHWEIHQMDVDNAFLHGDFVRRCTCIYLPATLHRSLDRFVVF
ncbi:unnamed protein product [Cuscuta epithymum]|uniref:Integrase catalytic domain-containing protein n=1 Tax=Cuscuta epithymum TaxID=186058 RepID=A0AAV0CMH1_9ASTE|nr:unnamed protein product [Cuscuta epithymum]